MRIWKKSSIGLLMGGLESIDYLGVDERIVQMNLSATVGVRICIVCTMPVHVLSYVFLEALSREQ